MNWRKELDEAYKYEPNKNDGQHEMSFCWNVKHLNKFHSLWLLYSDDVTLQIFTRPSCPPVKKSMGLDQ